MSRARDRLDPGLDLCLWPVLELEPEGDVAVRGHVRVQRVVLEHHRHPPLVGRLCRDVALAQQDAAAVRLVQAGDERQGRGLAAARGSEERQERARGHIQAQVVDRADLAEDPLEVV